MNKKRGSVRMFPIPSKRGQVTIFILVGVIILFAIAAVLYLTKTSATEQFTAEAEPVIATVPQEFQPLNSYTEKCLEDTAVQGLRILGQQGGYIYPELVGEYSASAPTDADGLDVDHSKIPYWHYNRDSNAAGSITFASLKPEVSRKVDPELSMEAQLARYVKEHLRSCLKDFSPLVKQGFVIEQSSLESTTVEVTIAPQTVNVLLTSPFRALKNDAEVSFDKFYVKIPLRLRDYYQAASTLTNFEVNSSYLERQGMELISVYSQQDVNYFPPTSDVSFNLFSSLSWSEIVLQERFRDILVSYIPLIRVLGSENFYYSRYPNPNQELLAQKIIDNMVLPIFDLDEFGIRFDYFDWPLYFRTNSEEGIIKPEHIFVNYEILAFGTQRYETHYDISYPVLATINDPAALGGEGYSFTFALESNIRNNQPAVGGAAPIFAPRSLTSLACKEEQRTTQPITTIVIDSFTQEPIRDVQVSYSIPDQTTCSIGVTNNKGTLTASYPAAYGGQLVFMKEGYITNYYPFSSYPYQEKAASIGYATSSSLSNPVIELDPIVPINVSVTKRTLGKCVTPLTCEYTYSTTAFTAIPYKDISCSKARQQCFFNDEGGLFATEPLIHLEANGSISKFHDYYLQSQEEPLAEDEEAILILERVSGFYDLVESQPFFTTATIKGSALVEIPLAPGVYKSSIIVTKKSPLKIPQDERCFSYDLVAWEKQSCFKLDESISKEGTILGNQNWNSKTTYFTITPEQLAGNKQIIFPVLTQDLNSVPQNITATTKECGAYTCIPNVGCIFEGCSDKKINIPARVQEDLQVSGELINLSRLPLIRAVLEPQLR